MANEAVIIELIESGVPIRYTVADGATIVKGTLLKLTDPRTAIATSADNDPFAGIASSEKVANDGSTTLDAYTKGIFDLRGSAAITAGNRVSISGANTVAKVAAADLLFSNVGIALETSAGAETIAVFVGHL
jgi:hypothetical protein